MLKNLPSFRNADIEKLKKMHPRAAQLITCVQLPDEWSAEMDQFMTVGADDLSLYERLTEYQRYKRDWKTLATAIFLDRPVDFYFPSEHFLCEIDRKRELTLLQLQKQVKKHLKRHLLYANEAQWTAHCDKEKKGRSIVVNQLEMATKAIHNFRLVQFWLRLTEEANQHTIMMQCFCDLGHKFCFCHYCWVMQILLNRNKSYLIPYEKANVVEVEDIPKRKAFRNPEDPAPSQI